MTNSIPSVLLLVCLVGLFVYGVQSSRTLNRYRDELEATLKHLHPTATSTSADQGAAAEAPPLPGTSLVSYGVSHPLSKQQFLLAVKLYAEAKARFDTLTYHSACDLVDMTDDQATALIRSRGSYSHGTGLYGTNEIFIKYPEVSPTEFIEAFDTSYGRMVEQTVKDIMAATVSTH